ncbi:MAG: MFS transporter, partial [Chloroflexi bacterium]|nr:MFS transporter [Chloroflexota bacterium]
MSVRAPRTTGPPSSEPTSSPTLARRRFGVFGQILRREPVYFGYYIAVAALVAQFVSVGSQTSVSGTFFKPMTDDLGWTRSEFTLAASLGRFVMAFAGFFIGVYVDRYGGRRLMMLGATIVAVALALTSQVSELWQWLLLRGLVFTIGAALLGNLVVNITLSKWFVARRGQIIGFSAMGVSLAGIVMPPLMTWVIDAAGWRAAWIYLAGGVLVLILPAALFMRRQPEDYGLHPDGTSDDEVRRGGGAAAARDFANSFTRAEALRTPALYMIVFAFGLGGVGIGAMLLQTIPFLTDEGYSRNTAALLSTTMSIPALVSKPFWGWMMDRWEPKVLASVGFVMSGVAMVVIVIAARHHAMLPLVLGFLGMGWGFGGQIPLQETIWGSYFGRRYLGSVRSVGMPFSLALGAGGPLAVSYYFDIVGNYDGAFFAIGGLWGLAAVLVLLVRRPRLPPRSEAAGTA